MGHNPYAACIDDVVWRVLCAAFSSRCVLHIIELRHRPLEVKFAGMCESCVAPILILIISMFYKKDEQVRLCLGQPVTRLIQVLGNTHIVVLCDGKLLTTRYHLNTVLI